MLSSSTVRRDTASAHPPGPRGAYFGLSFIPQLRDNLCALTVELREQFGDAVSFRVGPVRMYQFTHPDQVREMLVKKAGSFHKVSAVKRYFQRWMRSGLLLNEGLAWQRQRRKVRWALSQCSTATTVQNVAAELARLFPTDCGLVDVAARFDRLAFGMNVRLLFGEESSAVVDSMYAAANDLHSIGLAEMLRSSMAPDWYPTRAKARLRAAMAHFDDVLSGACQRRIANPTNDLLSQLLAAQDRQTGACGMSADQARDEAVNLLMGGKETVGATLTFASFLLAQQPQRLDALAAEAAEAAGHLLARRDNALECESSIDQLEHTARVLRETMRLYPPVYSLSRQVAEPVEIGGYALQKGEYVMAPVYAIHRDPRWYPDPLRFDPDRFLPEAMQQRKPYVFLPFGAGPRACVGKIVGFEQCVLALADLAARFRWRLAEPNQELSLAADIVLHPRGPLTIVFAPRDGMRAGREEAKAVGTA